MLDKHTAEIVEKHSADLAALYPSDFLVWAAPGAQRDLDKRLAMKRNKLHGKIEPMCKHGIALAEQVKEATAAAPHLQKHIDVLRDRSGIAFFSPDGYG